MKIRSVRGTHDVFGADLDKYNEIFDVVSFRAKLSNFQQLSTPIFEFVAFVLIWTNLTAKMYISSKTRIISNIIDGPFFLKDWLSVTIRSIADG